MDSLSLMIHVTAAAVLVGPQVLMFYAVIPSSWLIDDERLKRDLLAVVARRFGALAGIALITLLVTGLYQFYSVTPDFIREDINAYRYGQIFMSKMLLFTILLGLIFAHAFIFSKKIRALSDAVLDGSGDAGELHQARMKSFLFSLLLLLASLGTLWLGSALGNHTYSYVAL
jgi:uncharacterized membrane protein